MAQISMQQQEQKAIQHFLTLDNKGWNRCLFIDSNDELSGLQCKTCSNICRDPSVLVFREHKADEIGDVMHCHQCLTDFIQQNNKKCPVNGHKNPTIRRIKLMLNIIHKKNVFCPFSTHFKNIMSDQNEVVQQVHDTPYDDQKEGANPNEHTQTDCNWKGSLKQLIAEHFTKCIRVNRPTFWLEIENKSLLMQNHSLTEDIKMFKQQHEEEIKVMQQQYEENITKLGLKIMNLEKIIKIKTQQETRAQNESKPKLKTNIGANDPKSQQFPAKNYQDVSDKKESKVAQMVKMHRNQPQAEPLFANKLCRTKVNKPKSAAEQYLVRNDENASDEDEELIFMSSDEDNDDKNESKPETNAKTLRTHQQSEQLSMKKEAKQLSTKNNQEARAQKESKPKQKTNIRRKDTKSEPLSRNEVQTEALFAKKVRRTKVKKPMLHQYLEDDKNAAVTDDDDHKKVAVSHLSPIHLLREWNLIQYGGTLMQSGCADVEKWRDLTHDALKQMSFKPCHAIRFIRCRDEYFKKLKK